jgi:hypothetical protein
VFLSDGSIATLSDIENNLTRQGKNDSGGLCPGIGTQNASGLENEVLEMIHSYYHSLTFYSGIRIRL